MRIDVRPKLFGYPADRDRALRHRGRGRRGWLLVSIALSDLPSNISSAPLSPVSTIQPADTSQSRRVADLYPHSQSESIRLRR